MLSNFRNLFALASFVVAQTCYYPDGSIASELIACNPDMATGTTGSACCPASSANNLYPLDYPNCTPDSLCKAGNSDFLARGGCTDSFFSESECPQYCTGVNQTSMAGITDCGNGGPWYCCNADHDAGRCTCSPPTGLAFELSGNPTPIPFAQVTSSQTSTANLPSSTKSPALSPSSLATKSITYTAGFTTPTSSKITTTRTVTEESTTAPVVASVTTETVLTTVLPTKATIPQSLAGNSNVPTTFTGSSTVIPPSSTTIKGGGSNLEHPLGMLALVLGTWAFLRLQG